MNVLLQYALERFRRMYAEHAQPPEAIVDYVVTNLLLPGGDELELVNWYETRAGELRRAHGLQGPPLPSECTCTTDPACSVHGVPRAT